MKNIHLQLRNLIGQIESAMIQCWVSNRVSLVVVVVGGGGVFGEGMYTTKVSCFGLCGSSQWQGGPAGGAILCLHLHLCFCYHVEILLLFSASCIR